MNWSGKNMSKGMIKSTLREIKSSFGRYMAILLIIALGVGFFAGLKVTDKAMVHTANDYLDNLHFYDYRLVSTLGFDEDAAALLSKEEGVLAAEGAKSADIMIVKPSGTENTVKTISVPEEVNQLDLIEGRMPEKSDECIVDERIFGSDSIGKKITLSEANEEDDLNKFKYKEYTIVGLVRSPLYIRYDRGTTSLGDGTLDGFVYLPEDSYDMDYDTEIYVVFDKSASIYSEEYDNLMETKEEEWKDICQSIADSRYDRIYAEAQDKISDADKELTDKKADGEAELKEALEELTDGENQVADGENAIRKAKQTISDSEKTLEEKEKEYQKGLKTYQTNKKTYDKGKSAYDAAKTSYDSQYAVYEKNLDEYNQNKSAYDSSEKEYDSAKIQYENGKDYLSKEEQAAKETELAVWRQKLDETKAALLAAKEQLDAASGSLSEANKTLTAEGKKLTKAKKQLAKAKEQLDSAKKQIEAGKDKIASAKSQVSEKEKDLAEAKKDIEEGQEEYDKAYSKYQEKVNEAEQKIADAKEDLEDLDKPDTYVLGRDMNTGYANFENDSRIVKGIANVFPVFFFLVAALVCITTMTRMMEEQRTQIGVLKALGYSDGAIIWKYIIYSGSAAMIGAVSGFAIGTWAFPEVIWIAYKMMYNMGSLHYIFDGKLAIISILVAFLCSAGTTFISCYQELREMAAALMRPKAPKAGKRVLLERISFIWNHLKFLDKVSVRNLFRYKKRFFMMIIGISGCTALLVTGLGIKDSIADIADAQFDKIFIYNMTVGIREEPVEVLGMEDFLLVSDKNIDMKVDNKIKSVDLLVPSSGEHFGDYVDLHTEKGKQIEYPKDLEVVISSKLAENYNIKVGDTIALQDSELKGGTVKVSGIYQNYFNHFVLITPQTYEQLFEEEPEYNEMYVNVEEDADEHEVAAELMKEPEVSAVVVNTDIKQNVDDMMQSLNYVVILVIVCAAMLAFIVIYNLNNINITERMREIATIKVLGFYREETNSYIFRENIVLTLLGSMVGLVLGHFLHAFVMSQINIDAISFDVHVTVISYLLSILLTLLFNQIVSFFMSRKLEKIDMAESLKSVD